MPYRWRALMAVTFGTYIVVMEFSIVAVALPTLAREFDTSPDTVVWASLISSLVTTGLTLTSGRAGDLFGRKRIYIAGWAIFTAGMALASVTQTIEQLLAVRFFQAAGLSMVLANSQAIVADAFPENERGRSLGVTGAVVGAGIATGPVLGGVILSVTDDWHAIFYLRVPLGLLATVVGVAVIRETESESADERRLDIPGAIAIFFTLSTLVLAVNRGQTWGWTSPEVLGLFLVAAVAFVSFLRIESRAASPIIALSLFRIRTFSLSALSLMLNFSGQSAVTFLMPFYFIEVRDFSTAEAGALLGSVPIMMLLFSPLSGYVFDRFAFRYQVTLGLALVSLGLLSLSTLTADTPPALIVIRLMIVGLGSALFGSPNNSMIMNSVPRARLGTASGSMATSRNLGTATGLAISSAVLVGVATASAGLSGVATDELPPNALLDGIQVAFGVAAGMSALAVGASLFPARSIAQERQVATVHLPPRTPAATGAPED